MAKFSLIRNPASTDPLVVELRRRLDEFYSSTTTYTAFSAAHDTEDNQSIFHELMLPTIRWSAKILELGAGGPNLNNGLEMTRLLFLSPLTCRKLGGGNISSAHA